MRRLWWTGILVVPFCIAACSTAQGTTFATQSAATSAPTQSDNVGLVFLGSKTSPSSDPDYADVEISLGFANEGNGIATFRMVGKPRLVVAEGATYEGNSNIAGDVVPPGFTECGGSNGQYAAAFRIPAASNPKTLVWAGYSVDLSGPLGSCQVPTTATLPTSVDATIQGQADPGFAMTVEGAQQASVNNYTGYWIRVSITNKDTSNFIVVSLRLYSDRGVNLPQNGDAPIASAGVTSDQKVFFVTGDDSWYGKPIALFAESNTGARAFAKVP
jgi:hypothetical protein